MICVSNNTNNSVMAKKNGLRYLEDEEDIHHSWWFSCRRCDCRRDQGWHGLTWATEPLVWELPWWGPGKRNGFEADRRNWMYLELFQLEWAVNISQLIFPTSSLFLNSHFNHLKPYNSMAFSTFTMLCNHHHYLTPEHFRHPEKENPYPLKSHSLLSRPLGTWQH